jgi:hypothetical protein
MSRALTAFFTVALTLLVILPVQAQVPQYGTVFEGHSVPGGVALADLREYVEDPAVYGPPGKCEVYETSTACTYQIEGVLGAIVTG